MSKTLIAIIVLFTMATHANDFNAYSANDIGFSVNKNLLSITEQKNPVVPQVAMEDNEEAETLLVYLNLVKKQAQANGHDFLINNNFTDLSRPVISNLFLWASNFFYHFGICDTAKYEKSLSKAIYLPSELSKNEEGDICLVQFGVLINPERLSFKFNAPWLGPNTIEVKLDEKVISNSAGLGDNDYNKELVSKYNLTLNQASFDKNSVVLILIKDVFGDGTGFGVEAVTPRQN